MVEGHSCHRIALRHRKALVGKKFTATSPNGRFADGAAKINGKVLQRIEVHGKNLFYFFAGGAVVHLHFGMSGNFKTYPLKKVPPPRETTRLRLENLEANIVAHLTAMTLCLHEEAWYASKAAEFGPDPLREDADQERLWRQCQKTSRAVGLLLLDQHMVAGIGNIFRAEILFKAGIHPEQPAKTLSREAFERIWTHSVGCLQAGVKSGSIKTVDPEEAKLLGKPWKSRYIYNHAKCGRCKSAIVSWSMASRRAYACPQCQPVLPGTDLPELRKQVLEKAAKSHLFTSSCVPEDRNPRPFKTSLKRSIDAVAIDLEPDPVEPSGGTRSDMRRDLEELNESFGRDDNGKAEQTGKRVLRRLRKLKEVKPPISKSMIDDELQEADGMMPWESLRDACVEKYRRSNPVAISEKWLGRHVLSAIPSSYLSRTDEMVRMQE